MLPKSSVNSSPHHLCYLKLAGKPPKTNDTSPIPANPPPKSNDAPPKFTNPLLSPAHIPPTTAGTLPKSAVISSPHHLFYLKLAGKPPKTNDTSPSLANPPPKSNDAPPKFINLPLSPAHIPPTPAGMLPKSAVNSSLHLIARYPGLVDKVVFSHSLTSMYRNDAYTTNASEVKMYKFMRKILKTLPVSALTFLMGQTVLKKLNLQSGQADTKRLIALCKEDIKRITRQDLLTMADCMEDFLFNHTFTPEPYLSNPQNVLIIDSSTDRIANPMQRKQMLKLCPGAQEYHFKKGGHVTLVNCRNEYFSVLHHFLERRN
jgi:hypothetical protein